MQYALSHFNIIENDLEKLTSFIGPPLQKEFEVEYNFTTEMSKIALEKYRERFSVKGLYECSVIDGMENVFKELKALNCILAVATSKPEVYSKKTLDYFNLSKYFDTIVGSEFDGSRVEKIDVIKEVLNRLNIAEKNLKNVVMVGDRRHDIIGAKKAKIDSIGVRFGFAKGNELEDAQATYIATTPNDILSIVNFL